MIDTSLLKVTTPSEREIVLTREFAAPRAMVFDALTKPELVKRWLLGPPGWTMPECLIDLRVGGTYRFVWQNEKGSRMASGGVFREVVIPERYVATEKFDEPWYPGEAVVTTTFVEKGGRTTLTMAIMYPTKEGRDMAIQSGMTKGVEMSYQRLEEILTA